MGNVALFAPTAATFSRFSVYSLFYGSFLVPATHMGLLDAHLSLLKRAERFAKRQLSDDIRCHEHPPFENVSRPSGVCLLGHSLDGHPDAHLDSGLEGLKCRVREGRLEELSVPSVEEDVRRIEDILHPRSADVLVERSLEIPLLDCVDLFGRGHIHDVDLIGSNSNDGAYFRLLSDRSTVKGKVILMADRISHGVAEHISPSCLAGTRSSGQLL